MDGKKGWVARSTERGEETFVERKVTAKRISGGGLGRRIKTRRPVSEVSKLSLKGAMPRGC